MSTAINIARYDALFASSVQRSDSLSPAQLRRSITQTLRTLGPRDCAGRVAQEFGDHPETAAARMRWTREQVDRVFAAEAQLSARSHEHSTARVAA